MKKILLLTDLSKHDANLIKMAIGLCEKLSFDILVSTNYNGIPIIPLSNTEPSIMDWSALDDATQQEIITKIGFIREEVRKMKPNTYHPIVRSLITEGDIGINVGKIIQKEDVEIVVMGSGRSNDFEHLFFGNVVRTVLNSVNCPVLVVPEKMVSKTTSKIVLLTNFHELDINAFKYLTRLSEILDLSIEVLHIHILGKTDKEELRKEEVFIEQLSSIKHLNVRYTHLVSEKIMERINQLCESNDGDWLAMVDHPHSALYSFLHVNKIDSVIAHQNIPILFFPKKMSPANYFLKRDSLKTSKH